MANGNQTALTAALKSDEHKDIFIGKGAEYAHQ